ncbi:hypothetical protein G3M83_07335 [Rouxiella badensis]|uniref:hypothetical protein n=1 Tax=Rouxiella badensis TaxID=1646377 RepID=UPI0013EEEBF0|nr:hypothetical protein [Rouxiella badensis]QII37522.1 hypothetical protein G3M83_07335 [Rouxiella badensis]
MQKIGSITNTADSNGEWTNGKVATGITPTIIDASWLNTIQRELISILTEATLTPDPANDTQVISAMKKLFLITSNNLSEISAAGSASVSAARGNLGLGTAATKAVGEGANQIPDMNSFTSGNNGNGAYRLRPGGDQSCRQFATIPAGGSYTWTYPLAFVDQPAIFYAVLTPGASATSALWFSGVGAENCIIFNPNNIAVNVDLLAQY